ncbi:MAG: TonB-dependent receptor, partial [Gammaproteobacteria bacterium]|nr:TonB-dependent receptor [Gammaproteobacteria bacterium]
GNGNVGASVTYSYEDATDYLIAGGDRQKELLISRSNDAAEFNPSSLTVSDLGYKAESIRARTAAKVLGDGRIEASVDRWLGKDINFIHGSTIGEALVIHFDRMQRDTQALRFRKKTLGVMEDVRVTFANQKLLQKGGANALGTTLNSNSLNLSGLLRNGALRTYIGAEVTLDDAKTMVSSTQDYYAMFANMEYVLGDFVLSGGLRGNWWRTTQELLEGSNPSVARDLYGISGMTPPMDASSPTWSVGAVYMLNARQNLALNFSTTYRNPDLYERYAFGGVYGGGADMVAESGKNVELLWKYLDERWAVTASVFYSDFDNYITTKNVRQLTNPDGLRQCVAAGACNPLTGDFNGRENEFFSQFVQYYNSEHVTNQGAELSARYDDGVHDVRVALGYNDMRSDDIFVIANAQPIRLNLSYKHRFEHAWKPWAMVQLVGVTDTPAVHQYGGFEPYVLLNLYAGMRVDNVLINAGVGNLTDTVYHPPYGGINGLARHFFINLTYDWGRSG